MNSVTIPFGRRFENTTITTTGAATAVVSGEVLTCTSAVGENAKAAKFIAVRPGELLKVSFLAKRISGSDDTSGGAAIVYSGTNDRIRVTSEEWQEYSISYQLPPTAADAAFVAVEFGVFTADAGSVKFLRPRAEIIGAQNAGLRTIACGLITLTSGTPTVNTNFTSLGISALAYDAGTKTLTITTDKTSGAAYSSPLFFVGMTQNGNGLKIEPKAGSWSAVAGTVQVQFADTTTGLSVDIAVLGTMFMWFKAEIA
jgi:hypothetical protein